MRLRKENFRNLEFLLENHSQFVFPFSYRALPKPFFTKELLDNTLKQFLFLLWEFNLKINSFLLL